MAINRQYADGSTLTISVASGVVSGDAVALGDLPGVALTDRDSDGEATVQFDGVFDLEVTGEDDGGNAAISAGAIVNLQSDGTINIDLTGGVRFGYALAGVSSGEASTIAVKVGY